MIKEIEIRIYRLMTFGFTLKPKDNPLQNQKSRFFKHAPKDIEINTLHTIKVEDL